MSSYSYGSPSEEDAIRQAVLRRIQQEEAAKRSAPMYQSEEDRIRAEVQRRLDEERARTTTATTYSYTTYPTQTTTSSYQPSTYNYTPSTTTTVSSDISREVAYRVAAEEARGIPNRAYLYTSDVINSASFLSDTVIRAEIEGKMRGGSDRRDWHDHDHHHDHRAAAQVTVVPDTAAIQKEVEERIRKEMDARLASMQQQQTSSTAIQAEVEARIRKEMEARLAAEKQAREETERKLREQQALLQQLAQDKTNSAEIEARVRAEVEARMRAETEARLQQQQQQTQQEIQRQTSTMMEETKRRVDEEMAKLRAAQEAAARENLLRDQQLAAEMEKVKGRQTDSEIKAEVREPEWRCCSKCNTICYMGSRHAITTGTFGRCPAGSSHAPTANEYFVVKNIERARQLGNHFEGWRMCKNCGVLFIDVDATSDAKCGKCPAANGGPHDGNGSLVYAVGTTKYDTTFIEGFIWCSKCSAIWYDAKDKPCPAGGNHDNSKASKVYAFQFKRSS